MNKGTSLEVNFGILQSLIALIVKIYSSSSGNFLLNAPKIWKINLKFKFSIFINYEPHAKIIDLTALIPKS